MSEYMFGVSRQKPTRDASKRMELVAKRHGAYFVEATLPGTGYQRWFAGPNRGSPFDQQMAKDISDDLVKDGILDAEGALLSTLDA